MINHVTNHLSQFFHSWVLITENKSFKNFSSQVYQYIHVMVIIQYCAKVMRAKCANFVLCLSKLLKKVRAKIQASFHNILSVVSLKQRTKIRSIFKTRTIIPYQRDNSPCSMRNIAVQCADQYRAINVSFSCEQLRSP